MKNLSIKHKLWGVLTLFLVFYIITWSLSYYTSVKINEYLDSSKIEVMKQADKLRQSLRDVEQLVNDAAQLKDPDIAAEADKKADEFRRALRSLTTLDPERRQEYEQTRSKFDIYYQHARAAAQLLIHKDTFSQEILAHAEQVSKTLPDIRYRVTAILDRNYSAFTNVLDRSTRMASRMVENNALILFALLVFSALLIPLIIRTITGPIARLVEATHELAKGNLDAKADVTARDEIGNLALSFNEMTIALKEKSRALEKTTDELKMANVELQEADRLKSEFLASMSHELRTPLNAIINFSDQILEDWDLMPSDKEWSAEANDMLQRVLKSSKHLLTMINDLLDLAKIESGHMDLNLEKGDLRTVVADAVASVSSLVDPDRMSLSYAVADNIPEFFFDERKVLQIFINLLANAIKFTEQGSVRVVAELDKERPEGVTVSVIDTGVGIAQEHHQEIFDRFRQADGTDSKTYAGTGLGLNLVKELTELHGGWITVTSEKGKGSVFMLYFPFDPRAAKLEARVAPRA